MARMAFSLIYFVIAAIVAFLVVGCVCIPERFSSIEWYKKAGDWCRDAESDILGITGEQERLRHEPFPDINTVPDRVPTVMSVAERRAILVELVSDMDNTRNRDNILHDSTLKISSRTHFSSTDATHSALKLSRPRHRKPGLASHRHRRSGHSDDRSRLHFSHHPNPMELYVSHP